MMLDLYCGAGGASVGYRKAGFDVVGVDIKPQPNYPFKFHQADALAFLAEHGSEYDAIHASPPCQAYTRIEHLVRAKFGLYAPKRVDLIAETRTLLQATGKPWIIENVPGAPLINPVMLCGLMFGLKVIRHRLFESNVYLVAPAHPSHRETHTNSFRGMSSFRNGATHICVTGHNFIVADGRAAMGIDWMTREELTQAIPPTYTEWLGWQLMNK